MDDLNGIPIHNYQLGLKKGGLRFGKHQHVRAHINDCKKAQDKMYEENNHL